MENQRTIANPVSCSGVGVHTGEQIIMRLLPAPENSGISFKRIDIKDKNNEIIALFSNVSDTMLGTTIRNSEGVSVATIEHLMAAFWWCKIDNVLVEINGPEVPIMDGSSKHFIFLVKCAGVKEQTRRRRYLDITQEILVKDGHASIKILPAENMSIDMKIGFDNAPMTHQHATFTHESLNENIFKARTFGFVREVEHLRKLGLARGGSLDNAIVIDGDRILNEGGFRFNDELVMHKILDCIGDLYLAGAPINACISGVKSGHTLNNMLLRKLFATEGAWQFVEA